MSSNSSNGSKGVLPPPSSMLAILGTFGTALQKARISSLDRRASMNRMSAPSSANACARQIASSRDSAARASDLALMRIPAPSSRASTAARTLDTASFLETTRRSFVWPHAFGAIWSSISIPANPARAYP
eukprot:5223003-Pyramimonas_sp.AAC.1